MSLTKDVKFGPDWILHVDVSVNKPFSVASRWRYDYNAMLAFRCVQARTTYQTYEVWGRSDILWLSYNNIYSHGETSNFVTPPGTHPLTKLKIFTI